LRFSRVSNHLHIRLSEPYCRPEIEVLAFRICEQFIEPSCRFGDDRLALARSGAFSAHVQHSLLYTPLPTAVVRLVSGIVRKRIFPKFDTRSKTLSACSAQLRRARTCMPPQRTRKNHQSRDRFHCITVYSATCTPPPPGSFFFNMKLKKNMIPAAAERTIKVSMYASVPACACKD
jgi:hypothetical protein